jgi:hypothetical protein
MSIYWYKISGHTIFKNVLSSLARHVAKKPKYLLSIIFIGCGHVLERKNGSKCEQRVVDIVSWVV